MLQFIFLFLIILIFFIIALLAIPYHYALIFNYDQKLDYSFYFSVLFLKLSFQKTSDKNLLFLEIFSYKKEFKIDNLIEEENTVTEFIQKKSKNFIKNKFDKILTKNKNEDNQESEIEAEEQKKKSKFKFPYSIINKKNLNHLFKFLIKMINKVKPDYLKLYLLFSFGDPYYNGLFLAYYYAFKNLVNYPDIRAEINWQEVVFKAEGSIGGKIIPLNIIWQLLKFIFSIKSLKIFWKLYQSNSKKG